jgi:hypothetical protein
MELMAASSGMRDRGAAAVDSLHLGNILRSRLSVQSSFNDRSDVECLRAIPAFGGSRFSAVSEVI